MVVKRHDPSDNGFLGENSVIIPEIVYRYNKDDFWDAVKDRTSTTKTKLMNDQHEITIED